MGVNWPNASLIVNPRREIELATHSGRHIPNETGIEPNEDGRRQYEVERAFHVNRWFRRRFACGTYNCWGILHEEYRRVGNDNVLPGDIIVYRLPRSRNPAHGALVLRVYRSPLRITALSKWNIGWEDFHDLDEVPGLMFSGGFDAEIYTDRPNVGNPDSSIVTI